jgi:hypothetical protein
MSEHGFKLNASVDVGGGEEAKVTLTGRTDGLVGLDVLDEEGELTKLDLSWDEARLVADMLTTALELRDAARQRRDR